MSDTVDVCAMFYALRKMLPRGAQMTVDGLRDIAAGYVWGAEDFSGQHVHEAYGRAVIASWEFPLMYGIYACLYERGELSSRHSVPDAYRAFCASRDLGDYVAM